MRLISTVTPKSSFSVAILTFALCIAYFAVAFITSQALDVFLKCGKGGWMLYFIV